MWVILERFLLWGKTNIKFPNTEEGNPLYYEPGRVCCTFPAFFKAWVTISPSLFYKRANELQLREALSVQWLVVQHEPFSLLLSMGIWAY